MERKRALIAGASSGIGQRLAIEVGKAGAFVICSISSISGNDATIKRK